VDSAEDGGSGDIGAWRIPSNPMSSSIIPDVGVTRGGVAGRAPAGVDGISAEREGL